MSDIAIRVENLSKLYHIGRTQQHDTLRDAISDFRMRIPDLTRPNRKSKNKKQKTEDLWALKDISFEVKRGEVVGIIGRNGAGKSTLLKILSRITEPTSGRAEIHGRVGSLLEVGTGFHPELTGRENIYLNGAILGMHRHEIERKFDEIVAFAEIERFLDTPVKRYSSGMYVRLAFAVAAHLEPEILLVDEVLAVGDAQFQKKCLGKMGEVGKEGRTVLFVSHNMVAMQSLCREGVLLSAGTVACAGPIDRVVRTYLASNTYGVQEQRWNSLESAPGDGVARISRVRLVPEGDLPGGQITVTTPFRVDIDLRILRPAALHVSLHVKSVGGETVFAAPSPNLECTTGTAHFTCAVPGDLMNDGVYSIMIMIVQDAAALFSLDDALVFEIHDVQRIGWLGKWPGAIRPRLRWGCELVAAA